MTARTLRPAPSQTTFDARAFPVAHQGRLRGLPWVRLYKTAFPNQFFPSPGSRLTPASLKIPCVYLGTSAETAVAEVWGDRFAARRQSPGPKTYSIPASQADCYSFLTLQGALPKLRLCDLRDGDTLLAVGIDAATLYSPDVAYPQLWAERIAHHPARVDGIIYGSRHTNEPCLVLWSRPGGRELHHEINFDPAGPFQDSAAAYSLAAKVGLRLSFPT